MKNNNKKSFSGADSLPGVAFKIPIIRPIWSLLHTLFEMFNFLPKDDNAWVEFMKPFTKLIRKEKRKIN